MIIFNKIPCEKNHIKTKKITCTVWDKLSTEARINTRTIKGRMIGNGVFFGPTARLERIQHGKIDKMLLKKKFRSGQARVPKHLNPGKT